MIDYHTFADKIRAKHNAYHDVDDSTLAAKFIEKHPVYGEQVSFEEPFPVPQEEPMAMGPEFQGAEPAQPGATMVDTPPPQPPPEGQITPPTPAGPMAPEQPPLPVAEAPQPLPQPLPESDEERVVPGLTPGTMPPPAGVATTPSEIESAVATGANVDIEPPYHDPESARQEGEDIQKIKQVYEEAGAKLEQPGISLKGPGLTPEQQAEKDFGKPEGNRLWGALRRIFGAIGEKTGAQQTAQMIRGYFNKGEAGPLTTTQLRGKRYLDRMDELEAEKRQGLEAERRGTEEELRQIEAGPQAPPSESFVATEPPGGFPEMSTAELAREKAGEVREDLVKAVETLKEVPWKDAGVELLAVTVENLPVLVAGFGGIKKFKDFVRTAKKMGVQKEMWAKYGRPARRALLETTKAQKATGSAREALRQGFENLGKLPPSVQKAANFSAEVGVFLTPEALRTGEPPTPKEVFDMGLFFGSLKGAHAAYKRAKTLIRKVKEGKIKTEPMEDLRPEMEIHPEPRPGAGPEPGRQRPGAGVPREPRPEMPAAAQPAVRPPEQPALPPGRPEFPGVPRETPLEGRVPGEPPAPTPEPSAEELPPKQPPTEKPAEPFKKHRVQENKYVKELPDQDVDNLSGVANKDRITRDIEEAKKSGKHVMFLDGDYFKPINEVFGHGGGDKVIRATAGKIAKFFPDAKVGNPGGDEMVVIFDSPPKTSELQEFVNSFPKSVQIDGQPVTFSAGLGKGGGKKGYLYADELAGEAKAKGKNQIIVDFGEGKRYIKGESLGRPDYARKFGSTNAAREVRAKLKEDETLSSEDRSALTRTLQVLEQGRGGDGGRSSGKSGVSPTEEGVKLTQSKYREAEKYLTRRGRKTTPEEIRNFVLSGEKVPPPPPKRSGLSSAEQAARTQEKQVSDQLLTSKGEDRLGHGEKEVLAKNLPWEFSLAGEKYVRKRTKDPGVVKYNHKDRPFSTPLEVKPDQKVYIDKKTEMRGDKLFQDGKELFEPKAGYDALTKAQWGKISKIMRSKGHDVRGADDAKMLVEERGAATNPDWKNTIDQVLGRKKAAGPTKMTDKELDFVKEKIGTTKSFEEAGYINPDGTLLDFSGKRQGGGGGERVVDHRQIQLPKSMGAGKEYSDKMTTFMDRGGIRIDYNSGMIDLSAPITHEQAVAIRNFVKGKRGEVYLDIRSDFGKEYDLGTNPAKVIDDIRNYFEGIKLEEPKAGFKMANMDAATKKAGKIADKATKEIENGGPQRGLLKRGKKKSKLRQFIADEMRNYKRVDLRGHEVKDMDDVAAINSLYWRRDKYEVAHNVLSKDGKVVAHPGVTSRKPGSIQVFPETVAPEIEIKYGPDGVKTYSFPDKLSSEMAKEVEVIRSQLRRTGADEIRTTHNHPSGNVEQSQADEAYAAFMQHHFPKEFKGQVVVNHGKYSVVTAEKHGDGYRVRQETFYKEDWKPEDPKIKIRSSEDAAEFVKGIEEVENHVNLVFRDANGNLAAVTTIHKGELKNTDQLNRTISNLERVYGASDVVAAYFGKDSHATAITARQAIFDGIFLDFLYGKKMDWTSIRANTSEALIKPRKTKKPRIRIEEEGAGYKPEMGDKAPEIKKKPKFPVPFKKQLKVKGKSGDVFEWQKGEIKKMTRKNLKELGEDILTAFLQHERPIAKHLMNSPEGQKVLMQFQLSRGASAWSKVLVDKAKREIFKDIPHNAKDVLSNLAQAIRTIEVEKLMTESGRGLERLRKKAKEIEIQQGIYDELPETGELLFKSPQGKGAKEMRQYIDDVKKDFPDLYPKLEKSLERFWKESENQIRDMHKEGLLSDDFATYLLENHKHYAPRKFIEYMDPGRKVSAIGGSRVNVGDSGIEALKQGSEGALANDLEMLLTQMVQRAQSRIFKNRTNRELYNYAKEVPNNPLGIKVETPERVSATGVPTYGTLPKGFGRVYFWDDGVRRSILMPDNIVDNWKTSDPLVASNLTTLFRGVLMVPLLKAGATGVNPAFAFANVFRDMAYTWFKQHKAYHPIAPIGLGQLTMDMISVLPDVVKRKGIVEEYLRRGGGMDFLTAQGYLLKRPGGIDPGKVKEALMAVQEVLGWLGNSSEILTRVALMKRLMSKGMSADEAVWRARTNIDFAQGGNVAKAMDNFVPYLNAGIQGTRGTAQAIKSDPKTASHKIAQIIAMGAALTYFSRKLDEESYNNISSHDKRTGWVIPLGLKIYDKKLGAHRYAYLKIPKDHAQMFFAQIGEQAMNAATGSDGDFGMVMEAGMTALPSFAQRPPFLEALLTYGYNKDFYRNRDLWKGREVSPKMEKYPDTPHFWGFVGETFDVSPVRSEGAFGKIFPRNIWTEGLGFGWNKSMEMMGKKEREEIDKGMWEHLSSLPISRRFMRLTYPFRGDQVELMKDAQKYQVPMFDERQQRDLTDKELNAAVKKAKLKANDVKQRHDIELFYQFERFRSTGEREDIKKFIEDAVKKENSKRIITRFKAMVRTHKLNTPQKREELKKLIREMEEERGGFKEESGG